MPPCMRRQPSHSRATGRVTAGCEEDAAAEGWAAEGRETVEAGGGGGAKAGGGHGWEASLEMVV